MKQAEVYKNSLSEAQLLAIKNERKRLKYQQISNVEKQQRKEQLAGLGKPKKPSTAYLLFRCEHNAAGATVANIATKWAKLTDGDKQKYIQKANELREKYK